MEIRVEKITSKETYPVRHEVLRSGKPLETCVFTGDDLPTTRHFGAYWDETLIGVLSVYAQSHAEFTEPTQLQLRGMAVYADWQGKGIGQLLLDAAEREIYQEATARIWCNARVTAVGFYQKAGYILVGDAFDIPTVGPHYLMTKG